MRVIDEHSTFRQDWDAFMVLLIMATRVSSPSDSLSATSSCRLGATAFQEVLKQVAAIHTERVDNLTLKGVVL